MLTERPNAPVHAKPGIETSVATQTNLKNKTRFLNKTKIRLSRATGLLAAPLDLNGEIGHSKILILRFSQIQLSQPLELTQHSPCRIPNARPYSASNNARENVLSLL
jgi:hypothetical protein